MFEQNESPINPEAILPGWEVSYAEVLTEQCGADPNLNEITMSPALLEAIRDFYREFPDIRLADARHAFELSWRGRISYQRQHAQSSRAHSDPYITARDIQ